MNKTSLQALARTLLFSLFLASLAACSFGTNKQTYKSDSHEVHFNHKDWSQVDSSDADIVFVSEASKSTLLLNSLCQKYDATSLEHLVSNMLGGIDEVEIEKKENKTYADRKSLRTYAKGSIDGVPIFLLIQTVRKNECIYDFILISTSSSLRDRDKNSFEHFLKSTKLE